ncbi:DEAD/DEAH box helicase [Aeromicrobium sp. S22]|uniref:sacsin N-terminal ATP-binding-like domain-containing protein n=1 Tax=Aeromicrobium sp. S22 TaxID=2662029 RepID=UPI00129D55F7|nr:DEAD/DEAH box helicase family protein [Aeromicrobium sp. S22]MRK01374.1 DEAD/DEAH box helicase [Aeromicrobium sp. S22]
MGEWVGADGAVAKEVLQQTDRCLGTYREDRLRVEQDAAIEAGIAQGGYGRKQLYELIQNGADAMLSRPGNIRVVLDGSCLYVANEGSPLSVAGVHALMGSHLSRKRGEEIGRFGLGFKSVVAISDSPQVFSRSGSFGFDRAYSRELISAVVSDAPSYPIMRIARVLDAHLEASSDPVLAELMSWATTVVKVPFADGYAPLSSDLKTFPAPFLLFSPHAKELELIDLVARGRRVISVASRSDGEIVLSDAGEKSRWRVARRDHRPGRLALKDAGDLAHRESIGVAWAVPLSGRDAEGQFWAFFPTQDRTTLSGIVNAPWKLSDDRRNLLPGSFNNEILTEVLPLLIAGEWPKLHNHDDPAWALDLLPARGREVRSWADDQLNLPIIDRIRSVASLPDVSGALRRPADLRIHPRRLTPAHLATWASVVPVPSGWVHHSVDSNAERRSKAERLLAGGTEDSIANVKEWVEALLHSPTVANSAIAIDLVRQLAMDGDLGEEARSARIVMLEDGSLAPAKRGRVFVRSSADEEGFQFIHPELAALPGVVSALEDLGIKLLDRAGELRNALTGKSPAQISWGAVWSLSRDCSQDVAYDLMRDELPDPVEGSLRVRNRVGSFVPLGNVFVPGGVIKPGTRGDERFTLDVDFHREDLELLERFGAVSQPVLRAQVPQEAWLLAYQDLVKEKYLEGLTGAKPSVDKLIASGPVPPWPLDSLNELSPPARVIMTEIALGLTSGQSWRVRHATVATYQPRTYRDPVLWWVHKHGFLATGIGPFPAKECLLAGDGIPDNVFPTVNISEETARQVGVASDLESLGEATWRRLFKMAEAWDPERRNLLYAWGAYMTGAPDSLIAMVGERPRSVSTRDVAVVSNQEDLRSLVEQRSPVILVREPEDVERLIEAWGLENGKALLEQELAFEPVGEPQVLVDMYPKLRLWDVPASVKLQPCDSIELLTVTNSGTRSRPISSYLNDDVLLTTASDERATLRDVAEQLQIKMSDDEILSIIEHVRSREMSKVVAAVRSAVGVEEKLALLVGEEALVRHIPAAALESVRAELGREPTGIELARLAVAVLGVRSLQAFRAVLEDRGLTPPVQWAGGSSTRRFVADLGFPAEFAGFASDFKPAMFGVDGPAELDSLHDYQVIVTSKIKAMLRGTAEARGMVSLPTGAGKTRVAVQALVEEIAEGNLSGPMVWIAQSDELCEQAIETWSVIWRSLGPSKPLHIGRLWATNDVEEVGTGIQLVVATPQKLLKCKPKASYDWLTENSVVIVDEAHTSVAPMYTEVLDWLGLGRSRKGKRPLIGLTATPFRNTNVAETSQLASRYDKNRLDEGAFVGDPYEYLQKKKVLANVEQEILKGVDIELSAAELAETEKFKDIPRSVQLKLGTNVARNETILQSVASLPPDWTVLLFATSVDNARVLASLLTFRGIPAVSISAETDMAARRHYIDEFKAGRVRVITNYNVLAQGFDAPAVRAVYVTRPTYSANLYQQMIGRGLRGPLNGGSEKVKIVNVEDNVLQYGADLAFTEFEHLWKKDSDVEQ